MTTLSLFSPRTPSPGLFATLPVNIIRKFTGVVEHNPNLITTFSIESPKSQFWGLDNPDDNANVDLGLSTGSQTQNWVLDLIEY